MIYSASFISDFSLSTGFFHFIYKHLSLFDGRKASLQSCDLLIPLLYVFLLSHANWPGLHESVPFLHPNPSQFTVTRMSLSPATLLWTDSTSKSLTVKPSRHSFLSPQIPVMASFLGFIWVCSGCYNRTPRRGDLQITQTYFSQFWRLRNLRSRRLQIKATSRSDVWWGPISWLIKTAIYAVTQEKGQESLWHLFYKGTNPTHEGSTLMA